MISSDCDSFIADRALRFWGNRHENKDSEFNSAVHLAPKFTEHFA
jgi:hypothetical protein